MTDKSNNRLVSIDVMRGITLFLMLFVNDLYEPGVPKWLLHTKANEDGMGLADWVFPGFLFMVGMSIPFAVKARQKLHETKVVTFLHVIVRTLSLLLIGVLMLNSGRINAEVTGINRFVWTILMYVSVFLIWNQYSPGKKMGVWLRGIGVAMLVALIATYRSGTVAQPEWLVTGWWGILGLIGWGYFAAAVTYLLAGNNILSVFFVWLAFVALNVSSDIVSTMLPQWSHVFGVIINGNVPSITVAGVLCTMLLQKYQDKKNKTIAILLLAAFACLVAGFVLRNWFIISKIKGTPSWSFICNGITLLLFTVIFWITDVRMLRKWANPFESAGKNSLNTYLAPDIVYYICWGLSIPLFFYKQENSAALTIGGSLCWALTMLFVAGRLYRWGIKLKL